MKNFGYIIRIRFEYAKIIQNRFEFGNKWFDLILNPTHVCWSCCVDLQLAGLYQLCGGS